MGQFEVRPQFLRTRILRGETISFDGGLPVTCAGKDYSYLSATMGSTRIARRAGT